MNNIFYEVVTTIIVAPTGKIDSLVGSYTMYICVLAVNRCGSMLLLILLYHTVKHTNTQYMSVVTLVLL